MPFDRGLCEADVTSHSARRRPPGRAPRPGLGAAVQRLDGSGRPRSASLTWAGRGADDRGETAAADHRPPLRPTSPGRTAQGPIRGRSVNPAEPRVRRVTPLDAPGGPGRRLGTALPPIFGYSGMTRSAGRHRPGLQGSWIGWTTMTSTRRTSATSATSAQRAGADIAPPHPGHGRAAPPSPRRGGRARRRPSRTRRRRG